MARCGLYVVLLFSMVARMSALSFRPPLFQCTQVDRQCNEECGTSTCVVNNRCCYFKGKCLNTSTTVKTCGPFQCLNGGTLIPRRGKRDAIVRVSGCEVPPPVCRCPDGFSGRCCQNDPCALVDCEPGKTCKKVVIPCLVAPCPVEAECVPQDPCVGKTCPYGTSCKDMGSGHAECVRPGTCPTFPGLITTCQFIPGKNCLRDTECQDGYKCCSKGCGRECVQVLTDDASEEY